MRRPRPPGRLAAPRSVGSPALALLVGVAGIGACTPTYPACGGDGDCLGNEICVRGQCQQCRTDGDCDEAGARCRQGRCEARPDRCATDVECGAGARCREGRCVGTRETEAVRRAPAAEACRLQPVGFAFDDASLDAGARDVLEANAACVRARGGARMLAVGHADPRGTEEYNLALGERRARTVRSYLTSLGVPGDDVQIQSMGEELASGEDEAGWARDRRVELTLVEEEDRP